MAFSKLIASDRFLNQIMGHQKKAKVLMVNPFVSDFRLPWAHWHQPAGLLQLSSFLKQKSVDIRLVDFLYSADKQIVRRKLRTIEHNEYTIPLWRFGLTSDADLTLRIKKQLKDGWKPDMVFFTSLNSIWWEDVKEAIHACHDLLPDVPVYLGGLYATYEPGHAKTFSGADFVVSGHIPEATRCPLDISLYITAPKSLGIYFYYRGPEDNQIPRPTNEVVDEIKTHIELGVLEFVFFDDEIRVDDKKVFTELLDLIIQNNIKTRFVLLGNISVGNVDKKLAVKMKQAGVRKIYFKCNLDFNEKNYFSDTLEEYQRCMDLLLNGAGYKLGVDDITAMLVVGVPFEDLRTVTKRAIDLAHIVRSVIPVPFQYVPALHKKFLFGSKSHNTAIGKHIAERLNSPEKLNGKIYPFAELSGYSFEEYMELTRLFTLLNSKFRSNTFDFLGDSFTAKRFRESIRTKGWDPFKSNSNEMISLDNLFIRSEKE
jgi:hypothetical protein